MKLPTGVHHALLLALSLPVAVQAAGDAVLADAAMQRDTARVQALLDEGADPDSTGQYSTPALHWLVRYDELEAVDALLEAGADPAITAPHGVTPLSLAVANASAPMIELLLAAGASPDTLQPTGESVLMTAAALGAAEPVRVLLRHGAEVDYRDPVYGQSALMFAAREGHAVIASLLLEQGADPDAATLEGDAPRWVGPNSQPGFGFGIGIIRGGTPADRGRRNAATGGMTPLLYAARHDHREVAALLLEGGADIGKAEANGIFPLLMAISNDNAATARFLVERGAAVNGVDWYGRSPLWEAVNVRNLYMDSETFDNGVDREAMLGLIELLLEKGADVNARTAETPPFRDHFLGVGSLEWVDFTGQTPFLTAALSGDLRVMRRLLEYGADPHIPTYAGTTALMAAAGVNWVVSQTWTEGPEQLLEAVKLCLELGMDVNHANSMGLTALHGAANRGSDDIIRFLVDKGARLDARDDRGRTPLDWAKGVFLATHPAESKPSSVVLISELLAERGMDVR